MSFLTTKRQWPRKSEVEWMLQIIADSFHESSNVFLLSDSGLQTYRAVVYHDGGSVETSSHVFWEYDKLVLELESILIEETK